MRRLVGFLAAAFLCLSAGSARANTISFDFSNVTGASIQFLNGSFSFVDGLNGYDFSVTNLTSTSSWPSGSILGDFGNIGGSYAIGAVSSCGTGCQTATVTPTGGAFSLFDGVNTLTAALNWIDISTYASGLFGGLNGTATVNLSLLSYSGSNPDYLAILNSVNPTVILTFQFNPAQSLSTLKAATTAITNSYSGNFTASVVPEPASMMLLGTGLLGVAALARRRSRSRQVEN